MLYDNGAFHTLNARRKGSYATIPVQIPKSPFYSARLHNLVWWVMIVFIAASFSQMYDFGDLHPICNEICYTYALGRDQKFHVCSNFR